MTKSPSSHSDWTGLRPGWLVGYRPVPEAKWASAEVISFNAQNSVLILAVGDQRSLVTLDMNQPEHRAKLGTPF